MVGNSQRRLLKRLCHQLRTGSSGHGGTGTGGAAGVGVRGIMTISCSLNFTQTIPVMQSIRPREFFDALPKLPVERWSGVYRLLSGLVFLQALPHASKLALILAIERHNTSGSSFVSTKPQILQ
jgi:hypothetical protein